MKLLTFWREFVGTHRGNCCNCCNLYIGYHLLSNGSKENKNKSIILNIGNHKVAPATNIARD